MRAKDHIKPIGLDSVDFFRNFKGEVTIDLKDVKTGEVETYHDHNLVTKALGYFLKQGGLSNPSAFNASALRTDFIHYMLGGMMCLDTAITDAGGHDDEIVRVPAGVGMTANGAYNVVNTGNPPELGSWNELESGWQNDGSYKMVWDFTTSQGNGTIATVCLTSSFNGMLGIGNRSLTSIANTYNMDSYNSVFPKATGDGVVCGYDDNMIYIMENDFTNKSKINVNVYRFPVTSFDVRSSIASELLETIELNLPSEMQNLTGEAGWFSAGSFVKNGIGYVLVLQTLTYNNNRGSNAFIVKFNIANRTITVQNINKQSEYGNINMSGISDTHVILGLHSINLANVADAHDIADDAEIYDGASARAHRYLTTMDSDIFYGYTNEHGGSIVNLNSYKQLPTNGNGALGVNGFLPTKLLGFYNNATARDCRYIATIFNLDSAKTKSADKTMKVTYVLRFNEEEGE